MTTIGVTPPQSFRSLPMNVPSYSVHYPSMSRIRLASVKHGLFNPRLPSLRRMDMDTAGHKLPEEHSRTSTGLAQNDFTRASSTVFSPTEKRLSSAQITATGKMLHQHYSAPEELTRTRADWSEFLNKCPERYNIRLPELPENRDDPLRFSGYAVRYLRPELTSSWRYTFRQEPSLGRSSQQPIPATVNSRYRNTLSPAGSVSALAWRP